MEERLKIRVTGDPSKPVLIYLPGLHGDWTLVAGFKEAVKGDFRFVEFTYPRTLEWSLEDYAAAVEQALVGEGIRTGWVVAESYGSQVLWPLLCRANFRAEAAVLAGGFGKHPLKLGVQLAERVAGDLPLSVITRILFGYATVARFRYRKSPATVASLQEFIDRRTDLDRRAAQHRLRLIAKNDPEPIAAAVNLPIFAITGAIDPIVPWPFTRRWLRKKCPQLRDFKIVWPADHNVLGTAPRAVAEQIRTWRRELAN